MNKLKKVVVIYYGDDWEKKIPLARAIPTRESFEDWHERGLKKNIEMYRASIKWYDEDRGVFNKAWAYRNKKWIKIKEPIKPTLIFDKLKGDRDYAMFDEKMRMAKKTQLFNNPLFRTLCDNKLNQYVIFGQHMPQTFLASSRNELKCVLAKIKTKTAVIKPFYGSGGFGIVITNKVKALKLKLDYPVLAQEFIKSTRGIPGFSKKNEVADLRMVYINHRLVYALSRIAKKGSLFTNFHQGASAVLVPIKKIPRSTGVLANKIIKILSVFPEAHYSLDFIFTNTGKPVLVEMNTTPGFDLLRLVGNEKIKQKNFDEFIGIIK